MTSTNTVAVVITQSNCPDREGNTPTVGTEGHPGTPQPFGVVPAFSNQPAGLGNLPGRRAELGCLGSHLSGLRLMGVARDHIVYTDAREGGRKDPPIEQAQRVAEGRQQDATAA